MLNVDVLEDLRRLSAISSAVDSAGSGGRQSRCKCISRQLFKEQRVHVSSQGHPSAGHLGAGPFVCGLSTSTSLRNKLKITPVNRCTPQCSYSMCFMS